jgi:CDP-4-dehydro-6-deoxyglucose reductase
MFGFFKKNKGPFTANIKPLGKSITVKGETSENLLKVALENGIKWPHNCRVGSCGQCRCKLLSGKIKPLNDFSYVLSGEEMDQGYILACQTMLRGDIEVEVNIESGGPDLPKAKRLEGKIVRVSSLTHDILDVGIELEGEFKDYLPGQYADITVPGVIDKARSYSFSNAPSQEKPNSASFFIRRVPKGTLTEWLHADNRVGSRVVLDGPHGSFYLRERAGPMVLIAGGSGLAPIRALLQQIVEEDRKEDVTLIFGARTRKDLYCLDEIEALSRRLKGKFAFLPVLSMENSSDGWEGLTGHCPDAITPDMLDPSSSQAYMCGPPLMIDAAIERLKAAGLSESRIFFDKFLDASSMPGGRA